MFRSPDSYCLLLYVTCSIPPCNITKPYPTLHYHLSTIQLIHLWIDRRPTRLAAQASESMTTAVSRITPCPPGFSDHVYKVAHGVEVPLRVWPAKGRDKAPWLFWIHGGGSGGRVWTPGILDCSGRTQDPKEPQGPQDPERAGWSGDL